MTPPAKSLRAAGALLLLGVAVLSSGCASILHGGSRSITVNSVPAAAKVTITKADTGEGVHSGTTPLTILLDPKRGYFKGQPYNVKLELPGYRTSEIRLTPSVSGWYFGNILFGGLIGMVIVDPLTGSMWNLAPDKIDGQLSRETTAGFRRPNGFTVVLLSQVSESERARMVRIN